MSPKLSIAFCLVSLLYTTSAAKEGPSMEILVSTSVLNRLVKVEDVVERLQEKIKDLNRENMKFRQDNKDLRRTNTELRQVNDKLARGSVSKRLLLLNSTIISEQAQRIAFSVHADNHLVNLGATETYKFDVINDNEGSAYDPSTGVFICPVAGTYRFDATVMAWTGQRIDSQIRVNGVHKAHIVADASSSVQEYGQASNSLIIRLRPGDHVWLQHSGGSSTVHGGLASHFSGYILWAD